MEFVNLERGEVLQGLHHFLVPAGQRMVDQAHHLTVRGRLRLTAFGTGGLQFRHHIVRIRKARIVRIYPGREGDGGAGHVGNLRIGIGPAFLGPNLAALLQEPHARDIFQETRGSFDTALVGKILLARGVGNNRFRALDAHQAPGSAAQVGKLLVGGRHSGNGRCGIVSRHGDHGNRSHTRLLCDFFQQRTDYHARLDDIQQHRTIHADALQ